MNSNPLLMQPQEAWKPYAPATQQPWDAARVVHLHRRAGFGANWTLVQRDVHEGHEAAIDRALKGDDRGPDGEPASNYQALVTAMQRSFDQQPSLGRLQVLWLFRILFSPFPLVEKMTLAWHAHYATSFDKVGDARAMADQNNSQRQLWRSPIRQLHLGMLRDPAMLDWLDGVNSEKKQPNENLGREFLELFALGEGNYTEQDVKETARALTGWQQMADGNAIRLLPSRHDPGTKTVLGQTGAWNDEDVVRIACEQTAAARHIAYRLWRTFVADTFDPSAELLEALAMQMRVKGDVNVEKGIEVVLRSRLFHSEECREWRIATPVEYVAGIVRSCEAFAPCPDLLDVNIQLGRMGQQLFLPPNVAGWPGGLEWLRAPTIVARANFAAWLVGGTSGVGPEHFLTVVRRHQWDRPEDWLDKFSLLLAPTPLSAERKVTILTEAATVRDPAKCCAAVVQQVACSLEAQLS